MLERASWMKSDDTTSSVVVPSTPLRYEELARAIASLISLRLVSLVLLNVRSTTDTVGVGTRNAMPVSLPFTSGSTRLTAFAAPVLDGMMLIAAERPPFQSLRDGPSTVFCVAV